MAHEPEEMIKQQMLETRAALADKLETLEQQVVGTVHSATSAVTDTVACVKEAVQQTVESARESVHGTVEAVEFRGSVTGYRVRTDVGVVFVDVWTVQHGRTYARGEKVRLHVPDNALVVEKS